MSKLRENSTALLRVVEQYGVAIRGVSGDKEADRLYSEYLLANIDSAIRELERDAARYRYLRDGNSIMIFGKHELWTTSHRLDMVVDSLMEEE